MVSVCTVPAMEARSCEHFGGYKTINQIPLPLPYYGAIYMQLLHPILLVWELRRMFSQNLS